MTLYFWWRKQRKHQNTTLQSDTNQWMYRPQRWNQHYCVISDDNLYYAEEYEQEEEEIKKVG